MRRLAPMIILLATACGPSAAAQLRAYDARKPCYDAADAAAQARIDRECPGSFAECPNADDIIAELKLAHESCPQ